MTKKHNREKQAEILHQVQQQRKQQKKEQVLKAVQQLQKDKQPLTFPNIAKVAGCSVSYLYKWPEITAYIHDLQSEKSHQLHQIEDKLPTPYSLRTLHEVSKQRLRELTDENRDLKRQNELLRGYVAEIFELRDECERLRTQLRQLTSPSPLLKVVPRQTTSKKVAPVSTDEIPEEIAQLIQQMGIKLGVRLKREIANHEPEKVKKSILAFGQYRSQTPIDNPGACLLVMIREEAELNIPFEPTTSSTQEFDCWYTEAIQKGFCLDVPKNHLSIVSGELQVKVKNSHAPGGYINMDWHQAEEIMKKHDKNLSSSA